VIGRFGSDELAALCSKALLVDSNRNCQAPYIVYHDRKDHGDANIIKVQTFMEENYSRNMTMDEIAKLACLSPRQFKRRFKQATGRLWPTCKRSESRQPKSGWKPLRAAFNDIALQIGYEDSSTFPRISALWPPCTMA
jgi:transcriptional regulator GlxA family with amidase domain